MENLHTPINIQKMHKNTKYLIMIMENYGSHILDLFSIQCWRQWHGRCGRSSECGEVVSLHDLCLKYSSCFFGSFPLGHFIIDNICHRPAAALFDVNLGPEELGDQDKITSDSEKLSLVSTALFTL